MWYTIGFCWLPILHIAECTWPSQWLYSECISCCICFLEDRNGVESPFYFQGNSTLLELQFTFCGQWTSKFLTITQTKKDLHRWNFYHIIPKGSSILKDPGMSQKQNTPSTPFSDSDFSFKFRRNYLGNLKGVLPSLFGSKQVQIISFQWKKTNTDFPLFLAIWLFFLIKHAVCY